MSKEIKPKQPKQQSLSAIDHSKIPRVNANDLIELLQAKLGGDGVILQRGEEVEGRMDLRRPSGIVSLDINIGGGLPAGGLSQIDGVDGVGKNLLMNYFFSENQRIHGDKSNIAMVCLESNYDKLFGRTCGVQVSLSPYELDAEQRRRAVDGLPPLTKEDKAFLTSQVGNFHIFRGSASEKLLEGVVNAVAANTYQLIGIDSWDAMLTMAEENKELEDNAKVADASNVQTRWMKKIFGALSPSKICPECFDRPLTFKPFGNNNYAYKCAKCGWSGKHPYMWENETTLIGIKQVRANLNKVGMHAREFKVGGSWALRHGKLVDIELRRGESILGPSKEKIGKEINWEITKGKAGTHEGKKGMYTFYFSPPEIDIVADMVNYCVGEEIIKNMGSKVGYVFTGSQEYQLGKRDEIAKSVEDNQQMQRELRLAMLRHAGLGHIRYK